MGLRRWLKERKLRKPVLTAVIDWDPDKEQNICDFYLVTKKEKEFVGRIWFSNFIEYSDHFGLYNGNTNVDENMCGILWKHRMNIQVLSIRPQEVKYHEEMELY